MTRSVALGDARGGDRLKGWVFIFFVCIFCLYGVGIIVVYYTFIK